MSSPASLSGPIPFSHRVTAPPLIPVHLGSQHRTASLIFIIFMQSATDRSTQIFCSVMFSLYCMHVTDHPIHKTLERLKTRPSHIDIFLTSSWHLLDIFLTSSVFTLSSLRASPRCAAQRVTATWRWWLFHMQLRQVSRGLHFSKGIQISFRFRFTSGREYFGECSVPIIAVQKCSVSSILLNATTITKPYKATPCPAWGSGIKIILHRVGLG